MTDLLAGLQEDTRLVADAALVAERSHAWLGWAVAGALAAAVVAGYVWWRRRRRPPPPAAPAEPAKRSWAEQLADAQALADANRIEPALGRLAQVLRAALGAAQRRDFSAATTGELAAIFGADGVATVGRDAVRDFFQPVDALRFSGERLDHAVFLRFRLRAAELLERLPPEGGARR